MKNRGITLVALVITIVILLILAAISISALTNQGLFGKAKEAREKSENSQKEEQETLNQYEDEINNYIIGVKKIKDNVGKVLSKVQNIELQDEKGNKIILPAGFKITNDATTVDKGIVIEDATETATKGSQFVWIPVGTITKSDGTKTTITLGRYEFNSSTGVENTYSGNYIEEDVNDITTIQNKGNTIAKNITNFKQSATKNGGYYIGRYEARTTTKRTSAENTLTQITEKGTDQIYNYVKQSQAANLAQSMYDNTQTFTSDLMNSYSWDTAITFIQKCTNQSKYSWQKSLNQTLSQTGTTIDIQCNIFDMASNVVEWTTETSDVSGHPCINRGGYCNDTNLYTSYRNNYDDNSASNVFIGFRPILYINIQY